ncbi:hypothetical protein P4K96_04175 [Bacillus cereus]|nr:hypothetical protein [Bacillus cereus]
MRQCDICFGLKIYQDEPCIACYGTGNEIDPTKSSLNKDSSRNVYYEMYLNKYQHLLDENNSLTEHQREVLRVILTSDSYFIPFAFDGDWDYVYTEGKVNLVAKMLEGNWCTELLASHLEDDIYIYIGDLFQRSNFNSKLWCRPLY